jgi:signal transduction histidine kinase
MNLQLSIRHDGIGFDPDALEASGELGLVRLEECARTPDTRLFINGRPSHGIRMKMVVPTRGATRENSTHSTRR